MLELISKDDLKDPNEAGISSRERRRRVAAQKAAGVSAAAKAGVDPKKQASPKKFVYTPPPPPPRRPATPPGGRKAESRKPVAGKGGKYAERGKIGRGNTIRRPKTADKLTSPRWMANAAVNNPSSVAAVGAVAGAGALAASRKNMSPENRRKADVATGAALGGAAGVGANHGAFYGMKSRYHSSKVAGSYMRSKNGKTQFHGPNRKRLEALKSESRKKGNLRQQTDHFNRNFPKDLPGAKLRRVSARMGPKTMLASAAGGALLGGGGTAVATKERVKKSAFGVEHG